jgi:hypothetical protein
MGRSISQGFVDSLKRKAKRLERERPELTHSQALDLIAQQEGYENWSLLARDVEQSTDARRVTERYPYALHLRGIALDTKIELTTRLRSKHPAAHYGKMWINWKIQGGRGQSKHEATAVMTDRGELNLRYRLALAQRMVSFMDATDLRASQDFRGVFGSRIVPGPFDHQLIWKDAGKRYILTVEPYVSAGKPVQDWCASQGWSYEVLPKGFGIWNPCDASCSPTCIGHTQLIVVAPKRRGGDLQATVRAILSMPRARPQFVASAVETTMGSSVPAELLP